MEHNFYNSVFKPLYGVLFCIDLVLRISQCGCSSTVESLPSKQIVAGSNPVARSKNRSKMNVRTLIGIAASSLVCGFTAFAAKSSPWMNSPPDSGTPLQAGIVFFLVSYLTGLLFALCCDLTIWAYKNKQSTWAISTKNYGNIWLYFYCSLDRWLSV